MKKTTRQKLHLATRSKIAVAATILAIPLLSLPGTGFAEDGTHVPKSSAKFSIVGSSDGRTVYKNTEGKLFYLDPSGDMKFITVPPFKIASELKKAPTTSNAVDLFLKSTAAPDLYMKMTDVIISSYSNDGGTNVKYRSEVSIIGVDAKGNTVNENSRGEKFYLDAITGDMIFVDGKGLTAFRNPAPGLPSPTSQPGIAKAEQPVRDDLPGVVINSTTGAFTYTSNVITISTTGENSIAKAEEPVRGDVLPTGTVTISINTAPAITISVPGENNAKAEEPVRGDVLPTKTITVNLNNVPAISITAGQATQSPSTAPPRKSGEGNLPGLALDSEIPGVDVIVRKKPGGIAVSSKTDVNGVFHFDKLPAGEYELKVPGLPDQLLTVRGDGIAGGKLMKGSDGTVRIFDRWGNIDSDKDVRVKGKAAENPIGFGRGNTLGSGPGRGGPGMDPGMRPGPSPVMGGGSMGGPGGAGRH